MSSSGFPHFLASIPWFAWIAIVAIVCSATTKIVALQHRHRERIEMIRQGMDPRGGKGREAEL